MTCPVCGGPTQVYATRADEEGVYRRRKCLDPTCNYRFHTSELESDGSDFCRLDADRISGYRKEKKNADCKT